MQALMKHPMERSSKTPGQRLKRRPLKFCSASFSSSFSSSSSDFCGRFEDDDENEEEMQALYFQTHS
jgi:hypothetical protein